MVAIFLHFDFLQKTKKNWVFLRTKNKKKQKKFSTYIPSNNTTNSKFRKETKILSQKLKNFQKIQISANFLGISQNQPPKKVDFSSIQKFDQISIFLFFASDFFLQITKKLQNDRPFILHNILVELFCRTRTLKCLYLYAFQLPVLIISIKITVGSKNQIPSVLSHPVYKKSPGSVTVTTARKFP